MNHSPSPNLISPSGHINRSLLSPDLHDSNSNHSGQFAAGDSTPTSITTNTSTTIDHDNYIVPKKKNFKTEYKSKFTPFDQYVYNEVTDSFVRHSLEPNIAHSQTRTISSPRSNQDLANTDNNSYQQSTVSISTQAADVFSPSNEATSESFTNNEPWYKEVVRRNEKANEYRFKSEIGHNSPLSNYNSSFNPNYASNNLRVESLNQTERQAVSPTVAESMVGGELLTASDARSQNSDPQNELAGSQQESKQQFKFTPSDYKRDHLISHMANNNNFNLPKGQPERSTNNKLSSRCTQASSSARPTSRAGAQIRSRSQSTRRQPLSIPASSTTATSKGQSIAKSNQTTPTRTVAPRMAARSNISSTAQITTTKSPVRNTAMNSRLNSARPTTASPRTLTNLKTTPKEPAKRSPISTNPATKTTSSKSTNGSNTLSNNKMTTSSIVTKRTTASTPSTRITSARPIAPRSTNTSTISAGRVPKTNISAPSTRLSAKTSSDSKDASNPLLQNNAVKSIKTPKAIAAATAALAASSVAAPESTSIDEVTEAPSKLVSMKTPTSKPEPQLEVEQLVSSTQIPPTERQLANADESNQIFSTTETGNMLSDELAQAEKVSISKTKMTSFEQQVLSSEKEVKIDDIESESKEIKRTNEGLNSNELVNGLAGGLVSAEDRFDSSEKEISSEMNINVQQLGSDNNLYDHHDADEPYSIMPTTSQRMEIGNFTSDSFGDNGGDSEIKRDEVSNIEKDSSGNIQSRHSQDLVAIEELEKNDLKIIASEQQSTHDVNDPQRQQSFTSSSSSDDLSGKIDHGNEPISISKQESEEFSERCESSEASKEEIKLLESDLEKLNLRLNKSSKTNEDQVVRSTQETATLENDLQLTKQRHEAKVDSHEQQSQIQKDKFNEDVFDNALDKEEENIFDYNVKESDNDNSSALVEDIDQLESSSPKRQKLSESSQELEGESSKNDLTESRDLNESTPALASANTTLQEVEPYASAAFDEDWVVGVPYNNDDSNKTNLVKEALDDVNLHDIIDRQVQYEQKSLNKQDELIEFQQSENKKVEESNPENLEKNINRNELLMNVTDLIESESRKKLEMARKSEIAMQNISPQPPLLQSEILLSADHLTGQTNESKSEKSDIEVNELRQSDTGIEGQNRGDNESDCSEKSSKIENISTNAINFESLSVKMDEKNENTNSIETNNWLEDMSDKEDYESKSDKHIEDAFERSGHKEQDINSVSEELSNVNIDHDIDIDDQLKLSNPLTNSDDELILQPRNYNYSSPRYNEGIGLEMMAQEEDRLNGSVDLGDGSSAAIEQLTVAENRVEMLASKSIVPEISQTNYLFSRNEDSDEEVVDVLDSEKDLIDAEATIGHTMSVGKDELLRFNEVKEKVLEEGPNQDISHGGETPPAPSVEQVEVESKKDLMNPVEPTHVTSDVIDETVNQLHEHGELHRQLNKSQEERRFPSGLDELALRRQHSSGSSSSSSTSSAKIMFNDSKSEYDEFVNRMSADLIIPKNQNNNTTNLGSNSNSQSEEPVQSNQVESPGAVRTGTLLD